MGLFGESKKRTPKDMVKEWTSKIRKEGYSMDRQIRSIEREEQKVTRSLKEAAKRDQKDVCTVLAKELVRSKAAKKRIYATKANMKSVEYQMQQQLSTLRVSGALAKSTEVMKSMQNLVKIPELQATMRELSKEMMKAGIIEEMVEDTMEMANEDDELEEEAQQEVDNVLWEITQGELGKAPAAVSDSLPVPAEPAGATAAVSDEEEEEDMRARLEALRS